MRRVQMQHRDAIRFCKRTHRLTEAVTDALEQCWRGDWITKVLGQERNYLAAHLELGDVPIEVHPVKAFEVQHNMTFEHIVDLGCPGHPGTSRADRQTVLHRKPTHRTQGPELGGLRCVRRRTSLIQMGGMEPGLVREPGKMKHFDLTGMDDGHTETSESGAE